MSEVKKYGLIGRSLKHSFSQEYFTKKFDNQKVNAEYLNHEIHADSELELLLANPSISGLNVTIPYKEDVIKFLDELSPVAEEVGAVNTIQFSQGRKIGHNTDVFGFQQMIKPFFKSQHERAIILGTGGASKAVAYALERLGCEPIFISRTPDGTNQFLYSDINDQMVSSCKLVVNTTPVGMFPDVEQQVDFPYELLTPKHLVVDLIYNPETTLFLKAAQDNGAVIINGRTMLEQQAEKSWEIWNE